EIDVVLLPPPTTSTPAAPSTGVGGRARSEIVDQTQDHRVGATGGRSEVLKILAGSGGGHVWHGDVLQEGFGRGTDQAWIQYIGVIVELILLPGGWIEKLNRRAVVVGCLRKIAIA